MSSAIGGLRHYPVAYKVPVGAALNPGKIYTDSTDTDYTPYGNTVREEFNWVGADNAFKMSYIWKGINSDGTLNLDFTATDRLVDFAVANRMKVRGHVLLYGPKYSIPGFLQNANYTRAQWDGYVSAYIHAVVRRYGGKIIQWDVSNEIFDENGVMKPALQNPTNDGDYEKALFWRAKMGDDWLQKAFAWAKEADPACQLYYCDYNTESNGTKLQGILNTLVPSLGTNLDGLAFQCHYGSGATDSVNLREHVRMVVNRGLNWAVTELDVETSDHQGAVMADVARVCVEERGCTGLMFWGVNDSSSWKASTSPLLFSDRVDSSDNTYTSKPCYHNVESYMGDAFPRPGVSYKITNRFSDPQCLDVVGNSTAYGAKIQLYAPYSVTNQSWKFVNVGGGYYEIISDRSGLVLDLPGSNNMDGTYIQQWGTSTRPGVNQTWRIARIANLGDPAYISDDAFAIINRASQKPFWPRGGLTASGTIIEQKAWADQYSQQWFLDPAP